MTRFTKGQTVKATTDAQGVWADQFYWVAEVVERNTAFGNFVTYVVEDEDGETFSVNNGHLLFTEVSA